MRELDAIPLYFPTSYSLVKSYVQGFDINALDAPHLKDVRIIQIGNLENRKANPSQGFQTLAGTLFGR